MKKDQHTAVHTTSLGTEVEVTYEWIDDDHVQIVQYRRRPKGGVNFLRVKDEENLIVKKDQLPFLRGVARSGGAA